MESAERRCRVVSFPVTTGRILVSAAALLCVSAPLSPALDAQQAPAVPGAKSLPDTSVWRPVLEYVVRTLAPYIAYAATDTTVRPWHLRMPSTDAPWPSIEAHIRAALRARPVTTADSTFFGLEVGSLTVLTDTVRLIVKTSRTVLCAGLQARGGYANDDNVFVFRVRMGDWRSWSSARSSGIRHADLVGCPAPRVLPVVRLLMAAPASLVTQHRPSSSIELAIDRAASGCRVTATVAGAGAGMFLGAIIGYHVERAIYRSNEDAGVTGLAIGSIGGAIAGIQIARKACKAPVEDELRRQLRLQLHSGALSQAIGARQLFSEHAV